MEQYMKKAHHILLRNMCPFAFSELMNLHYVSDVEWQNYCILSK